MANMGEERRKKKAPKKRVQIQEGEEKRDEDPLKKEGKGEWGILLTVVLFVFPFESALGEKEGGGGSGRAQESVLFFFFGLCARVV